MGFGDVTVPNGTLEYIFHVQGMPINFISIYHSCQKGYKFEARPYKYVLKDIKNSYKVFYFGYVDHASSLYKFTTFHSSKNKPFYYYVSHANEISKLWHEILGHLNCGKMHFLSKMVHGFPPSSYTKGVCEGCVLGKYHKDMFDKGKAWHDKEQWQLIHSDICGPLESPSLSHAIYFLTFINDYS